MNETHHPQDAEDSPAELDDPQEKPLAEKAIPKLGEKPPPPKSTGPNAVRFTVRFLLFVMLCGAAYAFWVGVNQRRTKEQLRIVEPIKEYGADVNLWKGEVSRISLRYDEEESFDAMRLAPLAKLPKLKRLVLMDTGGDASMIEQLGNLASLEELLIFNANLSQADLAPLAKLKSLRVLWLCDCKLSDQTLDPLASMMSLRMVNLNDNQLTDNGLLVLAPLVDLEQVNIANNNITDNGINLVKQTLINARIVREPIPGYIP